MTKQPLNLKMLEKTFKLMQKHKINEVQCEEFTVIISDHAPKKMRKPYTKKSVSQEISDLEFLDKYTLPPSGNDEPWLEISEEAVDNYVKTGKH